MVCFPSWSLPGPNVGAEPEIGSKGNNQDKSKAATVALHTAPGVFESQCGDESQISVSANCKSRPVERYPVPDVNSFSPQFDSACLAGLQTMLTLHLQMLGSGTNASLSNGSKPTSKSLAETRDV